MIAVITGYCELAVYALLAAALLALFFKPNTPIGQWFAAACVRRQGPRPVVFRYALYAIMMAFLSLMASLNTFELVVDVELSVNPAFHLLDLLVWCVVFGEVFSAYPAGMLVPQGVASVEEAEAETKSERRLVTRASYVCLAVLGLASFVSTRSRFVAFVAVAPLIICMAYHLYATHLWGDSRLSRVPLLGFVIVGLYALIVALLGPGFTHVVSNGLYFLLAAVGHLALFADLFVLRLKTCDGYEQHVIGGRPLAVAPREEEGSMLGGGE